VTISIWKSPVWNEFLRTRGAPLLAGVVAAFLTNYWSARFSFRRFRQEQWWNEKREAYHSIIRKLSEIAFEARANLADIETGGQISPPKAPRKNDALSWSLQEIASSGAYIVSEKTVKAVEAMLETLASSHTQSGGDYYKELSLDYDSAQDALKVVRSEAPRELGML
jgi:hypothetical protein